MVPLLLNSKQKGYLIGLNICKARNYQAKQIKLTGSFGLINVRSLLSEIIFNYTSWYVWNKIYGTSYNTSRKPLPPKLGIRVNQTCAEHEGNT